MSEDYDGRQVVGLDLHRNRTVMVRTTADGERLEAVRFNNAPEILERMIANAGVEPQVVLEATYGWYWAVDVLQAAGAEVHLAHPLGVKGFSYRRVKNDVRDAADLADLLRMGRAAGGVDRAACGPRAVLVVLGLLLFGIVNLIERLVIPWHASQRNKTLQGVGN